MLSLLLATGLAAAPPGLGPGSNPRALAIEPPRTSGAVGASARLGVALGGTSALVQPVGFGFGIDVSGFFVHIDRARLGLGFWGGHTRFVERRRYRIVDELGTDRTVRIWSAVGMTDFSAGPALSVPIGPVALGIGLGAGAIVGSLDRPRLDDPSRTERRSTVEFQLRPAGLVTLPVGRDQGVGLGVAVPVTFSGLQVPVEVDGPRAALLGPVVELGLSYRAWF